MDQNGAHLFQPAAAVPQLPIHTTQREHRVPGRHLLPFLRSQSQAVDPVRVFKEHRLPVPLRRQALDEADVLPQIDDWPVPVSYTHLDVYKRQAEGPPIPVDTTLTGSPSSVPV